MSKKAPKQKLTIADLIAKKEQLVKKKKKTENLYLEALDSTVTIEEPERSLVLEMLEMANDDSSESSSDDFLVYNIMLEPNLKDKKLQEEFGCVEPTDIVSKIFDVGTVSGIAMAAMELAGYNSKVSTVDELKN